MNNNDKWENPGRNNNIYYNQANDYNLGKNKIKNPINENNLQGNHKKFQNHHIHKKNNYNGNFDNSEPNNNGLWKNGKNSGQHYRNKKPFIYQNENNSSSNTPSNLSIQNNSQHNFYNSRQIQNQTKNLYSTFDNTNFPNKNKSNVQISETNNTNRAKNNKEFGEQPSNSFVIQNNNKIFIEKTKVNKNNPSNKTNEFENNDKNKVSINIQNQVHNTEIFSIGKQNHNYNSYYNSVHFSQTYQYDSQRYNNWNANLMNNQGSPNNITFVPPYSFIYSQPSQNYSINNTNIFLNENSYYGYYNNMNNFNNSNSVNNQQSGYVPYNFEFPKRNIEYNNNLNTFSKQKYIISSSGQIPSSSKNYTTNNKPPNTDSADYNNECLVVNIKLPDDNEKSIYINQGEDCYSKAKEFCLKNHLNNDLIKPISEKIILAIDMIDKILTKELELKEIKKLDKIKENFEKLKTEIESRNKLNISCFTVVGHISNEVSSELLDETKNQLLNMSF